MPGKFHVILTRIASQTSGENTALTCMPLGEMLLIQMSCTFSTVRDDGSSSAAHSENAIKALRVRILNISTNIRQIVCCGVTGRATHERLVLVYWNCSCPPENRPDGSIRIVMDMSSAQAALCERLRVCGCVLWVTHAIFPFSTRHICMCVVHEYVMRCTRPDEQNRTAPTNIEPTYARFCRQRESERQRTTENFMTIWCNICSWHAMCERQKICIYCAEERQSGRYFTHLHRGGGWEFAKCCINNSHSDTRACRPRPRALNRVLCIDAAKSICV